jgi:protein TonB
VARAGGTGAAVPPEYDLYVQALRRRIQERLAYPWLAVRRRLQGILELDIHLDADGRLTEVAVVSGDGPGPLREAAIRAVREATPFPFPPELVARALRIRLPVVFELR